MEAVQRQAFFKGKLAEGISRVTESIPCPLPSSFPSMSMYYHAGSEQQPTRFQEQKCVASFHRGCRAN
ncbi:hypothetical protein GQ457_10G026780 [Hibiscus cannabinus]